MSGCQGVKVSRYQGDRGGTIGRTTTRRWEARKEVDGVRHCATRDSGGDAPSTTTLSDSRFHIPTRIVIDCGNSVRD